MDDEKVIVQLGVESLEFQQAQRDTVSSSLGHIGCLERFENQRVVSAVSRRFGVVYSFIF